MKSRVTIVFTLLFVCLALSVVAQKAPDKDKVSAKPQILESGVITKIDLKKMTIIVRGVSYSFPEVAPGQRFGAQGGRGGRGGRGGGNGGGGSRGDSNEIDVHDMKVYVSVDTFIEKGKAMLKFGDLQENAQVTVIGASRGKSGDVDAFSISVSDNQSDNQ